ncbi:hypothetical protein [Nonomuraea typhae]|uniref:hypothetical protein n=1 Tax=Nonomuraea typhae TaxID=2603600 RepID=UPI0012F903EE|nr:hypothetical protein [Nonomuraea typhae]
MRHLLMTAALILTPVLGALPASAAPYCGGTAYAKPRFVMGDASTAKVAYAGGPGYRKHYQWLVVGNIGGKVAIQALGFENGRAKWFPMGITDFGRLGQGSVPWGRNLAYPQLRAQSNSGTGVNVAWTC